ncbi:MAG: response regulator, partial [Candidatus Marinimicrobia bacterium]|nr:response regulator [Candidatus Neomarinimicrobiota bacterium]
RMLERLGYRVLTVASGREALEALDSGALVAAVLLVWAMPHMSGEETYHEIQRRKPGLPVLLASGYSTEELSHRPELSRVAGFLQKPFATPELRQALEQAPARTRLA